MNGRHPGGRPIFQMCSRRRGKDRGWIFPGELESQLSVAPAFTIAWRPGLTMQKASYFMPGEEKNKPVLFSFRVQNGSLVLKRHGVVVSFSIDLSNAERKALPYVGRKRGELEFYGKDEIDRFIPVTLQDLDALDRLYLDHQVVLIGVTDVYGPHIATFSFAVA